MIDFTEGSFKSVTLYDWGTRKRVLCGKTCIWMYFLFFSHLTAYVGRCRPLSSENKLVFLLQILHSWFHLFLGYADFPYVGKNLGALWI